MICQPFTVDCFDIESERLKDDETSDPFDSSDNLAMSR